MNTQPIDKIRVMHNESIEIHSVFHTLQGEGPFTGRPAVFIRLYGCNLQCPLCDTDYTSLREILSPAEIVARVSQQAGDNTSLVVISGGEPLRQPIAALIRELLGNGYQVQVETNGTAFQPDIDYRLITVVCSPKTGSINKELKPWIDAYKYVAGIEELGSDGLPNKALEHQARPFLARPSKEVNPETIFLQAADYQNGSSTRDALRANEKALEQVVNSCLKHGYRICLQTHKIIGVA